jgi:hypothetical protein
MSAARQPAFAAAVHTADRIDYGIRRQTRPAQSNVNLARDRSVWLTAIGQSLKDQYDVLATPVPRHIAALVEQFDTHIQQRHWLDYDPVAVAVLVIGIGLIELLGIIIWVPSPEPSRRQPIVRWTSRNAQMGGYVVTGRHPLLDFNQKIVGSFDFLQYLLCLWILRGMCASLRKLHSFNVLTQSQWRPIIAEGPSLTRTADPRFGFILSDNAAWCFYASPQRRRAEKTLTLGC